MATSTKIKVTVEKTSTGFSAYCDKYPIFTTGRTVPEMIANCVEGAGMYFEGRTVTADDLHFEIDFKQFFQHYKILNAKYLAERIGINAGLLSQYVQGRKKPSEKQTEKILLGIQQVGRELSEINLIYRH
jgi:hypothetical protein